MVRRKAQILKYAKIITTLSVAVMCYAILLLLWCKFKIRKTDVGLLIDRNVKEIQKLRKQFAEEDAQNSAMRQKHMHRGEPLDPWL